MVGQLVFHRATVKPDNVALRSVSPVVLDASRSAGVCAAGGESMHVIDVRNGHGNADAVHRQWSVFTASVDPTSVGAITVILSGPDPHRSTITLPAAISVLHCPLRAFTKSRPWARTLSPMQMADRIPRRAAGLLEVSHEREN